MANVIALSSLSVDEIWDAVKKIKQDTSIHTDCSAVVATNVMYAPNFLLPQVKAVEQILNMVSSELILENITSEDLKNGAEMFIYLNYCPGNLKSWFVFYKDLFQNQSPAQIMLTLNRMMKVATTPRNKFFKNLAHKLLEKTTSYFRSHSHRTRNASLITEKGIGKNISTTKVLNLQNCLDLPKINHPVHIITKDNQISPSALIPFCDFGGDMSSVGVKIDQFDVPVCNSFQAKILNDQLCYEVDLNLYSNRDNIINELKVGFYFLMDYNEDRQLMISEDFMGETDKKLSLARSIAESQLSSNAIIYLDTVGT